MIREEKCGDSVCDRVFHPYNHSFGAFFLVDTPQMRRDLSINHPGGKKHTLIERVLNIPRHK